VAAAAKSGSPVLKIILAVLAVLIFFSLLIVGGCVYFIYRAKQKVNEFKKEAHITFPTEAGTREVRTEPGAKPTTEAVNMDVPIYPGATPTEAGGDMSMGAGVVKVQQYVTDDAVDKVVSFYKDKLGSSLTVQQSEGKAVLQLVGSAGLTNITVFRDDSAGKTKFSITRIGK
jgi:cbb3-type cytochrome oxidase subunit 3